MARASQVDVVVVGGGVVGLAAARALARRGHETVLVERHAGLGRETSSHNSGVIHAGLYYPPGSWKARLSVEGRERLYAYCEAHGVPAERTGKWILAATEDERPRLEALAENAARLGAADLVRVSGGELQEREPLLRAAQALWSPHSGIVDVHALMDALARDFTREGGAIAHRQEITELARIPGGVRMRIRGAADADTVDTLVSRRVVNAAGHDAARLARALGVRIDGTPPTLSRFRGDYLALDTAAPRPGAALVYPLPGPHGLGVHLTRDLGGRYRLGPDAYPVRSASTRLDALDDAAWARKRERFAKRARRYLPDLRAEHLEPDQAGVRPKLLRGGVADFALLGPRETGVPGIVHLLGIESPGLTACLALGAWVADALGGER